jgi:hypothetical protein
MLDEIRFDDPAKSLFWSYSCNRFYLDRDDKEEEYLRLGGGDPGKEKEWRQEYINYWLSRMTISPLKALRCLRRTDAHEAIDALLMIQRYEDDYIKFWFADTLYDLSCIHCAAKQDKKLAKSRAKLLWQEILNNPVKINHENREKVNSMMLAAMNAKTPEEYIQNYTIRKLQDLKMGKSPYWNGE